MPLEFREGFVRPNLMQKSFMLQENPFRISAIYNPDNPGTYEPKMYGKQYDEFYEKFFIQPLNRGRNKQVIGAIWSSQSETDWRGFGKSMLMSEESKKLCSDFGASMLAERGVHDDAIAEHPVLAGYCTFDQAKDVKTFASALLDAVAFMLEQPHREWTVHRELRSRVLNDHDREEGYEGETVRRALRNKLGEYATLNVQLNHRTLDKFISLLASNHTADLTSFIRNEIGPRIKANQGFNFVHVFNAYAALAGIVSITYFVDQIENFAKWARNQDREIKVLRESMCQTSPTAEIASFIFQMHITALEEIENWWVAEHLPSLDFEVPLNRTRTINLKGLQTTEEAIALAKRYLKDFRVDNETPTDGLHPFPVEVVAVVRDAAKGNPRKFLEILGQILDYAVAEQQSNIDLLLVEPLLGEDYQDDAGEDEEDDLENVER